MTDTPYKLSRTVEMRWANPENFDAARGSGGKTNHGRKGSACRGKLKSGETWTIAEAQGSGIIRKFWITLMERDATMLRGIVLRIYWDGATKPAVEAPLGDFFGSPLGRWATFANAWFDSPEGRNWNCFLPMPFRQGFKITVTNDAPTDQTMFWYQVDFTLGDQHADDVGYLHAHYRRENPTKLRQDFEFLPRVTGRGRYLGCNFGAILDQARYDKSWWGEGEVKIYLDGDRDYPTLCGTGTEDYICSAWGQGQFSLPWYGCPIADKDKMQFTFYRLHGPDPIYFQKEIRVTIQQMGCGSRAELSGKLKSGAVPYLIQPGDGTKRLTPADADTLPEWAMFEREDDWSATAFFYLDQPTNNLPAIAPYKDRIAGLV